MIPESGTRADKAYNLGKKAAIANKPKDANPYITNKAVSFRAWWEKGFNDVVDRGVKI